MIKKQSFIRIQYGFRRNRSTTSQIFTIRRILEGVQAKNLQATILSVDFTKAFDSIHRGKMSQILLVTKGNHRSHNYFLQKHQSESASPGLRHRLLRHCSWGSARRHTCPIPLYHLSRLRA